MPSMSVSGIVSGMDWEGMITTMLESAQKPAQVQMTKRINLTNKKSLFEEMQELAEKLQKSTTALRLESTYKAKTVETERIDSNGSAKGVLTAKVNADAQAGVYTVKVSQLAQAQTLRSDQITNSKDFLTDYTGTSLFFTQDGQKIGVTLSDGETLESLSSKINNTIKTMNTPMNFTSSVIDGRLIFKSDSSGLGNVVTSNADAITYNSSLNTILPISVDTANLADGDFVIKDDKGNTYTNGVHFDIVDGNQIRWRTEKANTVNVGDEFTVKYTAAIGDVYTTDAITRGSGNVDENVLNFNPNFDDTATSQSKRIVITDSEGFTYNFGTDFTIDVSTDDNGNTVSSIRWLKGTDATRPDEGVSYTMNYTCGAASLLTSDPLAYDGVNRAISINDAFGSRLAYEDLSPAFTSNPEKFYITSGSDTYQYGTDFTIRSSKKTLGEDKPDIYPGDTRHYPIVNWTSGGNHPSLSGDTDNPTLYTLHYDTLVSGGEIFNLKVTRGNTDTLATPTTTTADATSDGNAVITVTTNTGTTTYREGTNFELGTDASGNITVNWIQSRSAPANGATYDLNFTTGTTGQDVHLKGVKTSNGTDATSQTVTMTNANGTQYYEGVDFTLSTDENNNTILTWNEDATRLINPGDSYTLKYSFADGSTTTYTGTRATTDSIKFSDKNFSTAAGTMVMEIDYDGTTYTGANNIRSQLGINVNSYATYITGGELAIRVPWQTPTTTSLTAGTDFPADGAKLTYEYRHSTNTFQIDDNGSGLLQALGIKDADGNIATDDEHYTAAQNALITVDGEEWTLASNELEYDNDILKGVNLELKGTGTVILDVTHDTDKAVENVQTFIDDFNVLMDWINVRSTEKEVNSVKSNSDEDTVSNFTRSNDEFNTSWGLLYGNSYLRTTKSSLRSVVSQNFNFTFKERESLNPVYGDMSFNGLRSNTTLRIAVGDRYANITIEPGDTLTTIAAKINKTGGKNQYDNEAYNLHYDENGNEIACVKASVVNDKLVLTRGATAETNNEEINISGSTAMNLLNLNYTCKGLYQVGIETTSDNYGISGQLDFSADKFREALEDNPEEVQSLMTAFAKQMDSYMKSMLNSSSTGSGSLKTQISNLDSQITTIDDYLKRFQERIDRMETRLRSQYAAAEKRISELSQQASSISGILSQLNAGGGNSSAS